MNEQILDLLKENNKMLKQIIQYINQKESDKYRQQHDFKEFLINVLANAVRF